MADFVGRTLGHFKVLEALGTGGMGEVFLAEDQKLGRLVALKILAADVAADADRLERFEREARILATLSHPGIVTVHSIDEAEGLRFITMERVQGQTLRSLIPKGGLPTGRFFQLAIPLVDALSAAHQHGVTHRDLKPDNVMVTDEGRVKVLDFGLAKSRGAVLAADNEELKTTSVTGDDRILGTVAYMSPEQAQGQLVDHRSDIFSLGILLYEMATGERPFKGSTNLSILSAILKETPPPVTDLKGDLPRPLARMIQRALEKNPNNRYQSTLDLRKDLEDLRRDVETGEVLTSRSRLALLGAPRRRWLRPLAFGAALIALVGGGLLLLPRLRRPPASPAAAAFSDGRPSLAVFYFENLTGEPALDWLRSGLTDMLVTDLSQTPGLRVLSTAQLYQLLSERGHLEDRRTTLDVIQAVARDARVTTALVGSFVRAGETLRISARLQDARSGEVISSERVEGQGEASIFPLVDDLTRRIKARLNVSVTEAGEKDRDLKEVTTSSVEAYRSYAEGYRLHTQGREEEALPKLEKAVEVDPDFAMALAKLAVVHGNLMHEAKAEEYGRRALERVDRLPPRERYYIEGVYYQHKPETVGKAIAAFEMAVERFPDQMAARNNLAQLLAKMRRYDEAIRHLEELRAQGMTFPGTYQSLAEAYAAVGQTERGLGVLRSFVAEKPESVGGQAYLGMYLTALGHYDEAQQVLDRAEVLAPNSPEVTAGRCSVYLLTDRFREAEELERRLATSKQPLLRRMALFDRALVHAYAGRIDEAVAALEQADAVGSEPGHPSTEGRLLAADLLMSADQPGRALAQARLAEKTVRDTAKEGLARAMVAVLLTQQGQKDAGRAELDAAGRLVAAVPGPLLEESRYEFEGHLALAGGDAPRAIEQFQKALALLPAKSTGVPDDRYARAWYGLAQAHLRLGHQDEAATWFRRVTEAGTERLASPVRYVRSLYQLAQIHEKRGEAQEARKHFQRFLGYWKDGTLDRPQVAEAERKVRPTESR